MDEITAFDAAVKAADLGLSVLSTFVLVCAAFVGWLLAEQTVVGTPRFSGLRWCLWSAFFTAASTLAVGAVSLFERAASALDFAGTLNPHPQLQILFASGSLSLTYVGLAVPICATSWLILWYRPAVLAEGDEP